MDINTITSIGWLHNADKSIALTIAIRYQIQPVFVSISKAEFDNAGGIEGINQDKQKAIDFYNAYGAGRKYKG
jgi:hypothetical protein